MKRAILTTAIYALLGALATVALMGIFVLLLSIPDLLRWVSGYIGVATTWILFLFIIDAVIARCVSE